MGSHSRHPGLCSTLSFEQKNIKDICRDKTLEKYTDTATYSSFIFV